MTEPGQPWVMISGSAFSCWDLTWMKWMSTPSISVTNCGRAFSLRLDLAPVVVGRPVARERLDRRQLHALRRIGDELLAGEAGRGEALLEVVQVGLRDLDLEGADGGGIGVLRGVACGASSRSSWTPLRIWARAEPVMPSSGGKHRHGGAPEKATAGSVLGVVECRGHGGLLLAVSSLWSAVTGVG